MRAALGRDELAAFSRETDLDAAAIAVLGACALCDAALDEAVEHPARRRRRDGGRVGQRAHGQRPGTGRERLEQVELRCAQLGHRGRAVEAAACGTQRSQEVVEAGGERLHLLPVESGRGGH